MTDELDRIDGLIEESSLGTPGAKSLRRRTPANAAKAIAQAADHDFHLMDDAAIIRRLHELHHDLEHPFLQEFQRHLYEYGLRALANLWRSDQLFSKCRRMGLALPASPPATWDERARFILTNAVIDSVPRFVSTFLRKWEPDQGQSIHSHFINFVLYTFVDTYRQLCKTAEPPTCVRDFPSIIQLLPPDSDAETFRHTSYYVIRKRMIDLLPTSNIDEDADHAVSLADHEDPTAIESSRSRPTS